MRRLIAILISLSLSLPVMAAPKRDYFDDAAIPENVRAELSSVLGGVVEKYKAMDPEEGKAYLEQVFANADLLVYQILLTNKAGARREPRGPMTVREKSVARYALLQLGNQAIAKGDVKSAEFAVQFFNDPEAAMRRVSDEETDLFKPRPELEMSEEALAATLRAVRLALGAVDRQVGHELLAKVANFKLGNLKKLEDEIRRLSGETSDDEGVLAERLEELVDAKVDKRKDKVGEEKTLQPSEGLLADTLNFLADRVEKLGAAHAATMQKIDKWTKLRRERRIESQKQAKALRASFLVQQANERAYRERDQLYKNNSSSQYSVRIPSAGGTTFWMATWIVVPQLVVTGFAFVASAGFSHVSDGLFAGGVFEVIAVPVSIALCNTLLGDYSRGQAALKRKNQGY